MWKWGNQPTGASCEQPYSSPAMPQLQVYIITRPAVWVSWVEILLFHQSLSSRLYLYYKCFISRSRRASSPGVCFENKCSITKFELKEAIYLNNTKVCRPGIMRAQSHNAMGRLLLKQKEGWNQIWHTIWESNSLRMVCLRCTWSHSFFYVAQKSTDSLAGGEPYMRTAFFLDSNLLCAWGTTSIVIDMWFAGPSTCMHTPVLSCHQALYLKHHFFISTVPNSLFPIPPFIPTP